MCNDDEFLSKTQFFKWYKSCGEGREVVEEIKVVVLYYRRLTRRDLLDVVISKTSLQTISKDSLG